MIIKDLNSFENKNLILEERRRWIEEVEEIVFLL
jgi:hypothetical protein